MVIAVINKRMLYEIYIYEQPYARYTKLKTRMKV